MNTDMPAETPVTIQNGGGAPRATLLCRPNSHPFNDRNLVLDQEIKIGRSVARSKPTLNNAIFDCKVLSRNHAVLWYSLGKFYLQDTKSSNGTFVNNQRLSKGAEESAPREVCSGDILQFGVDVMENSRKVTHGCIIATLKLFLPDGKEAKASPSIENSTSGSCIPPQDLYQLNTFIQESLAREQLLENKLLALQAIISDTELSSKNGWRALMEEDRLLTRVEILENQLSTYSKSMGEDKLREEAKRLMEDKEKYQSAAKENLKKLVDDKLEAVAKCRETETSLRTVEDELASIRGLYNSLIEENNKLSEKISGLSEELKKRKKDDLEDSLQTENKKDLFIKNAISDLIQNGSVNGSLDEPKGDTIDLDTTDRMTSSTDSLDGSKSYDTDEEQDNKLTDEEIKLNQANRLRGLAEELVRAREKYESDVNSLKEALSEARSDSSAVLQELNNTRNKLDNAEKLIDTQDNLLREMELRVKENSNSAELISASEEDGVSTRQLTSPVEGSELVSAADMEGTLKRPVGGRRGSEQASEPLVVELNHKISHLEEENCQLKEKLLETKEKLLNQELVAAANSVDLTPLASSSGVAAPAASLSAAPTGQEQPTNHQSVGCEQPAWLDGQSHGSTLETLVYNTTTTTKDNSAQNNDEVSDAVSELEGGSHGGCGVLNLSCSSCGDLSAVEQALQEAEEKIARLLATRDRLAQVQNENRELEMSVSEMEEEIEMLSVTSRYLTACNLIPVLVMFVAVVIAFLPSVSSVLGTRDQL